MLKLVPDPPLPDGTQYRCVWRVLFVTVIRFVSPEAYRIRVTNGLVYITEVYSRTLHKNQTQHYIMKTS